MNQLVSQMQGHENNNRKRTFTDHGEKMVREKKNACHA